MTVFSKSCCHFYPIRLLIDTADDESFIVNLDSDVFIYFLNLQKD